MYRLTKDDLTKSAYYCAAETDIQPILRFGDIISDFIYVSVGIKEFEFIAAINSKIDNLCSQINCENILKINSIEKFDLTEIEHPHNHQLFQGKPEYMNDNDFQNYLKIFNELRNCSPIHYNLVINFTLKIGEIEKSINVYHISGEALATYDAIFVKQNIAPKIFLSIQSGVIEIPKIFTDKMFELHEKRPLVWVRGIEVNHPKYNFRPVREWDIFQYDNVFTPFGVFDKTIGNFDFWDSKFGINISGDTTKRWRNVKAFGESRFWDNLQDEVIIEKENIKIRKLLKSLDWSKAINENYTKIPKRDPKQTPQTFDVNFDGFLLNSVYKEYKNVSEIHNICEYKIGAQSWNNFEAFELYINEFVSNFKSINNLKLSIDLYYEYPLDFKRDF